jgi:N-acetyl-gamma-glutamyl-phosphate reductase
MKPKIFIDGEHGTTGLQLMARLAGRHDLEVISIPEAERRNRDLREQRLNEADIAILCLPDDAARESVAMIEASNSTRVIDTSTAHRVHPDWAYGFAEMDRAQRRRIAEARFVANPGCYPTGAIALIRPLVQAGILPPGYPVSVNAVSGYSGGGKQLIAQMENASAPDHIDAPHFLYGLTLAHKHVPEMQAHGLMARPPIFAPSVGRFAQGMIVQVPLHVADLEAGASPARIREALIAHYSGQEIVQVASEEASRGLARLDPTALNGTDRMELHVFANEKTEQVNLVAVLDNLGKGASGAALQNMDIMLGG